MSLTIITRKVLQSKIMKILKMIGEFLCICHHLVRCSTFCYTYQFGCVIGRVNLRVLKKKKNKDFARYLTSLILDTYFTHFSESKTTTKNCAIYTLNRKCHYFFYQTPEPFCFKVYDTCRDLLAVVACKKHFLDHKNIAPTWTIVTVLVILTTSDAMCSLNSFTVIW